MPEPPGPDAPPAAIGVTHRTKLWLGLGAFVLLGAGEARAEAVPPAGAVPQGGEGGEGGEAGIDAERAASDPQVFLLALDVIAAHYLAGRAAYAAGKTEAAAELFAHPVAEVYADLEPVLEARGVAPFRAGMEKATTLALDKAPQAEVGAAVAAVLAAVDAAEAKAPGAGPTLGVRARAVAELLDRAALQHAAALRSPEVEPYLDGLGFFLAAEARAARILPALSERDQGAVRETLRALAPAFPGVARPSVRIEPGPLSAQAAKLRLALADLP